MWVKSLNKNPCWNICGGGISETIEFSLNNDFERKKVIDWWHLQLLDLCGAAAQLWLVWIHQGTFEQ